MNDGLTMDEAVEKLDSMDLLDESEEEEQEKDPKAKAVDDDDENEDDEADDSEEEEEPEEDIVEYFDAEKKEWTTGTRDEAKAAGLRQADYTRKTMELAEQRRAAEAAQAEIDAERARVKEWAAEWAIEEQPEPDWAGFLRQGYSTEQVLLAQQDWKAQQQQRAKAAELYRQLEQEDQEKRANAAREYIQREFPEWSDPGVARKANEQLTAAISHYGLPGDVVANAIRDIPQIVRVLHDAARYREMADNPANLRKRVTKPGETLRPGSKVTAKQQVSQRNQKAMERFKRTGTMEDAVEALSGFDLF